MLLHINKFIDRVRAAESRASREVVMSLTEARDLQADIAKMLVLLQDYTERAQKPAADLIVEIDGGSF